MSFLFICFCFFVSNNQIGEKIHENSGVILSELVVVFGEQDRFVFLKYLPSKIYTLFSKRLNKFRPIEDKFRQVLKVFTFIKSTPSSPAKDLGNFFSTGSMVPGSGILRPQKNSLDLKICICRGIKSPKLRRIKYNWSTSDLPGHKASPEKSKVNIRSLHLLFWSEFWSHS
jgi:bacterioferritin-associated ferredoxin